MLHTVTLSPGFDDYYTVSGLDWGGVGTMHAYRSVASGKGVSCARSAAALGVPVVAHVAVGADDAGEYAARLDAEGLSHGLVTVPGSVRHNLTLVDGSGEKVAAHFMGERLRIDDPDAVEMLFDGVLASLQPDDIVTLNGSLAQGLADDAWAQLAAASLERGARVIVDAQGAALRACLAVRGITAFKPNDEEIRALPGLESLTADERVERALQFLDEAGATIPLVSLGARGVAVLREGRPAVLPSPADRAMVSVMAGDTFVAGLAWGLLRGADGEEVVRHGLAAAAAHVEGLAGASLRSRAEVLVAG
ncbi:1-phosphofructokinase family hexose kinase [Tessaracoccus flavus]|uniref:Uncharacterized protein n=1 Tax=Tessaracoccus flavus TaxID=1610493 RepID=A0A1Q2CIB9_9ACTN|nr:PfkB family carbohydrate kinase [Tessaracoccus flavus]AQP45844.1 hypothetical protein RPIT_14360 [Tessaracoccus flavus]SDZ15214.1 fructose-1-phosphate kinase [Tessaracoccus flavus]